MTIKELFSLTAENLDYDIKSSAKAKWDSVAKPLDGLGEFEEIISSIAMIKGNVDFTLDKKALVVMISDNGIVEEGVSQCGQNVTKSVAVNLALGRSSVSKLAGDIADIFPVDIGIAGEIDSKYSSVINRKVRLGSRNFLKEPAMTMDETLLAIKTGIDMVKDLSAAGYSIIATGEMGIGNTTSSSAIIASLLKLPVREVTGRGAGLSDEGYSYKCDVIGRGIFRYDLGSMAERLCRDNDIDLDIKNIKKARAFSALSTFGGYDIAGMTGIFLGAAIYRVPVIIDGVISLTSALIACDILEDAGMYMIPSHMGLEPAMRYVYEEMNLNLKPVLHAGLKLGEGSGAIMMFPLLDMAHRLYNGTTFKESDIENYKR